MNVLVTGGSGFLGRRVIPSLVDRGYGVTALARSEQAATVVRELGAEPIEGDLGVPESIRAAFSSFAAGGNSTLLNLASLGSGHAASTVAAAEGAGLARAVFVSTTAIFTNLNVTSKTVRLAAEEAVQQSALDWTIVRPTMIYGAPDDRNMARLLRVLHRWPALPMPGGGRRLQQPIHVEDLAAFLVSVLDYPGAVRMAYDVAGPEALTLRQMIEEAGAAVGKRVYMLPMPLNLTVKLAKLGERIGVRALPTAEQFERLAEDKRYDITAAKRDLAFDPRPFREGIAKEAALLGLDG